MASGTLTYRLRPAPPPLVLEDHGISRYSAQTFFRTSDKRDVVQAARLCEQFHRQNTSTLALMECTSSHTFDGARVTLNLKSNSMIGAVPLRSPQSAATELALVVQPRFPWAGLGPMLADMGWRIIPRVLKLPRVRTSERRVPPWVLSAMVINRVEGLLASLSRRFGMADDLLAAPKGSVDWAKYGSRQIARANPLAIPCRFPDLVANRSVRSAARFALERQHASLATQRGQGRFIHNLMDVCGGLLHGLRDVRPEVPSSSQLEVWLRSASMSTVKLRDGIEAIEWTVEERGLAGLSEIEGLPWAMSMDSFYEAWVETVFREVARQTGSILKVGRKQETTRPLVWDSAYLGSQKSLRPDLILERNALTLIVDAKYKRHWEDLRTRSWSEFEEEIQEHHRNDLMQALAYANLSSSEATVTCLAYPCSKESWEDFQSRRKLVQKATIPTAGRSVELWLAAVPMAVPLKEVVPTLTAEINRARS